MKNFVKHLRRFLCVILLVSAMVYPGFMAMMSAAGWMYNANEGHYPSLFRSFAGWMIAGGVLLLVGTGMAILGTRPRLQKGNAFAIACTSLGTAACMIVLYKFCAYADQNFSGIGETMQPVSELYRDRLLPILLPAALSLVLSVWNLCTEEAAEYRLIQKRRREEEENREAPKILGD